MSERRMRATVAKSTKSSWLLMPAVGAGVLGCLIAATASSRYVVLMWSLNLAISLVILLVAGSSLADDLANGRGMRKSGSFMLGALNVAVVTVPSATLIWRTRTATVERLLGGEIAADDALSAALGAFSLALVAFSAGEWVASSRAQVPDGSRSVTRGTEQRHIASLLLVVGLAASSLQLTSGIGAGFDSRGEAQGQGILSMAGWALPLGISISILFSHWGSRLRVVVTGLGLVAIVLMGVRSPLIMIAIASVPRLVEYFARTRIRLIAVLATGVVANSLIAVGAGLNAWRGAIRHGEKGDLGSSVLSAWLDPIGALSSAGVDTVDGALFVSWLPPGAANAGPTDLLKAFALLIPRQLYPGKPELLSNILSREYLGFGTAGMFLSGVGYLELVLGGLVVAVLAFGVLGLLFGRFAPKSPLSVAWVVSAYVLVRFYMGGDAYDFFVGLQLALVLLAATTLVRAAPTRVRQGRSVVFAVAQPLGRARTQNRQNASILGGGVAHSGASSVIPPGGEYGPVRSDRHAYRRQRHPDTL